MKQYKYYALLFNIKLVSGIKQGRRYAAKKMWFQRKIFGFAKLLVYRFIKDC